MIPFTDLFSFFDYGFHRPFVEEQGYSVVQKEDGSLLLIVNALGIAKDNIEIEVKPSDYNKQIIAIKGKTHDADINDDLELKINFLVHKEIVAIEWDTINGFLKVLVKFEQPVTKPPVPIIRK